MSELRESRWGRWAVAGLLGVCVLLAAGIVLTAWMNERAAQRAATAVLESRAAEVAGSFAAAARQRMVVFDDAKLGQLAQDLATDGATIAIYDGTGRVIALAPATQSAAAPSPEILESVRSRGQARRRVEGEDGHFEFWRPLMGFGPMRGWGRRWRELMTREQEPGSGEGRGSPQRSDVQDPRGERGPPGPGRGFGRGRWGGGGPPPARLLRVTVPLSVASEVTAPAHLAMGLASAIAAGLLVLGALLFLAARRAERARGEYLRRRALASLGEMAATLAHEIRTPLGSIKGNAQLVGEAMPEDPRVTAIVREAGRLERLVNGLLDYARPAEPRRLPSDPDEILLRAAEIVAPKAAAASVNLVTDPAHAGPCLSGDPDQLLQVLVNLLQNAIEASAAPGATGKTVVVRARRARGTVTFSVLDSGPGLQGAPVEQLLRPFYSTKDRGTGLGLAVAGRIVEAHGGELTLQDRKEGGTAALVILPEGGRP